MRVGAIQSAISIVITVLGGTQWKRSQENYEVEASWVSSSWRQKGAWTTGKKNIAREFASEFDNINREVGTFCRRHLLYSQTGRELARPNWCLKDEGFWTSIFYSAISISWPWVLSGGLFATAHCTSGGVMQCTPCSYIQLVFCLCSNRSIYIYNFFLILKWSI